MRYDTRLGHSKDSIIAVIRSRFTGMALSGKVNEFSTKPQCAYLSPQGNRCAIGLYIPDGHAAQRYDGAVCGLLCRHDDLQAYMPFDNAEALSAFQNAHDGLDPKATVSEQMQCLIEWVQENVA